MIFPKSNKASKRRFVYVFLCLFLIFSFAINTCSVFANEGNSVDTIFFGNLKDDGKGCGFFMVLNYIIDFLTFGVGIAAAIGITVSGVTYLTAGGDEAKTTKAKRRILEIVIGLAVYVALWAILNLLLPGGNLNSTSSCGTGTPNNSFFTPPTKTTTKKNGNDSSSTNSNGKNSKSNSDSSKQSIENQDKVNYQVYLEGKLKPSKLKKGSGIIVLEPDDNSSKKDIEAIKKKGYTVLGYISVGSYEGERKNQTFNGKKYYKGLGKYAADKMDGWPEDYAKVEATGWQKYLLARAKSIKAVGYDGIWADNLDVYEYRGKTSKIYSACKKILSSLKKYGYVMVNGGQIFFEAAMNKGDNLKSMVDGVTQEEVITQQVENGGGYSFKAQESGMTKDRKDYMNKLHSRGIQTFLLEYTKSKSLKNKVKKFAKDNNITGYYVSGARMLKVPSSLK